MKDFIKAMDNLPWIVKLILCLPALDIVWAIYRIVKGVATKSGILWIVPGIAIGWLIDLISTIVAGKPILFA